MTCVILCDLRLSAWQASVFPCVPREKEGSPGGCIQRDKAGLARSEQRHLVH